MKNVKSQLRKSDAINTIGLSKMCSVH